MMHCKRSAFSIYEISITLVIVQILVGSWYILSVGIVREMREGEKHFYHLAQQSRQVAGLVADGVATVWAIDDHLGIRIVNIGSKERPWLIIVPQAGLLS